MGRRHLGHVVHGLECKTGKRPAVVGLSLLEPDDYDARGVDCLIDHHRRGGLVTVSTHSSHPWRDHPVGGDKYRVKDDLAPKPDLRELLSTAPDSPAKRLYWSQVRTSRWFWIGCTRPAPSYC